MARDKICTPFLALASPENKFTVNTIEDMQSRKYLKIGDVVELNGYYTAGDGAGHKRKIEATDDGSGVQLANGLWANIVHNGEVNVSWFGAKGDGVADDSWMFLPSVNKYNIDTPVFIKTPIEMKGIVCGGEIHVYSNINIAGDIYINNSNIISYIDTPIKSIITKNIIIIDGCKFSSNLDNSFLNISGASVVRVDNSTLIKICLQITRVENCYIFRNIFDLHLKNISIEPIHVSLETEAIIKENKIYRSVTDSIDLYSSGKNTVIKDNIIEGSELNSMYGGGSFIEAKSILRDIGSDNPGSNEVGFVRNLIISGNKIINCKTSSLGHFSGIFQKLIFETTDQSILDNLSNTPHNIHISENFFDNIICYDGSTIAMFSISGRNVVLDGNKVINISTNTPSDLNSCFVEVSNSLNCILSKNQIITSVLNAIVLKENTHCIDIFDNFISIESKFCLILKSDIKTLNINNNTFKSNSGFFYGDFVFEQINITNCSIGTINATLNGGVVVCGNIISEVAWIKGAGTLYIKNNVFTDNTQNYSVRVDFSGDVKINGNDFNSIISGVIFYKEPNTALINSNTTKGQSIYSVSGFAETGKIKSGFNIDSKFSFYENLNTPYHATKMQQEGVYNDFIDYMDAKTEYDRVQREQPEGVMMLPVIEEPQPSEKLLAFKEKYLG